MSKRLERESPFTSLCHFICAISFIQQIFMKGTLCAGHSAGPRELVVTQDKVSVHRVHSLLGKTENKHANLCSVNVSLLSILFSFFQMYTSAFPSVSALQMAELVLSSGLELAFNSLQIIFSLLRSFKATVTWLQ